MHRPSHPTNPFLHLYPPPPHPPPPQDLSFSSNPQQFLRFREFHQRHFVDNKEFFQFTLNPKPLVPRRFYDGGFGWNQNGDYWNQLDEEYCDEDEGWIEGEGEYGEGEYGEGDNNEWNGEEENGECNEEEEKVEFVLSDEMIAMFRFSELRRLKRNYNELLVK